MTQALKYIRPISVGVLTFGALVVANFLIARHLLGLSRSPLVGLAFAPRVSEPLVIKSNLEVKRYADLLKAMGLPPEVARKLPSDHPLLADIAWAQRANPYPPLLGEFDSNYVRSSNYISFGYIGIDRRYHQITYYAGEADTTPSFLVQKVRGSSTSWGDYFVWYLFFVSKGIEREPLVIGPGGEVDQWADPQLQIDHVAWGTYEGGSYNGFEEMVFVFVALILEFLVGVAMAPFIRRKRASRLAPV